MVGERDREPGAGQLPARQLPGQRVCTGGEPDQGERLHAPVGRALAGEPLRELHVGRDGEVADEVRLLVENADPAGAQPRALLLGPARERAPSIRTMPPSGSSSPARHASSVDLPEPGRAGDGHHLAGLDRERDTLERERLVVSRMVEAEESVGDERGGHHVHVTESLIVRHGSTLSAPFGPDSVSTTSLPPWKKT